MSMNMSRACALAIHAMALLAKRDGKFHTARDMARELASSSHHVAKVMQRLARHGLALSRRGSKGGFVLAASPTEITLFDIYLCIEGKPSTAKCLFGEARCAQVGCMFDAALEMSGEIMLDYLRKTSLAEAARKFSPKSDLRTGRAVVSGERNEKDKQAAQ